MAIPARNTGAQLVHYLRKSVTFNDTTAVTVGKIPAGSLILKAASGIHVTTAFNAGTNNNLDIGTSVTGDLFATDMSVATATFVPCDEAIGGFLVAADTTITAVYQPSGTAASAGAGVVVICYVPNNDG